MSKRRRHRSHAEWTRAGRTLDNVFGQYTAEQIMRAVDAASPPGYADQLHAALADARKRAERTRQAILAAPNGAEIEPDATAREQLYGQFLRIVAGIAEGTVARCPHISLDRPRPAIALVCGTRVDCHRCARNLTRPALSEREEHTCDLCRGYVPGQTIHAITPQCGVMTLIAGVCDGCLKRMGWTGP